MPHTPRVLVVMGPAGAGKTTVGQALAARLAVPFVDADDHHDEVAVARMRAGHPLTDADRAPWLARLNALIAAALAEGRSFVLACSALKRAYREALRPADAPPGAVRFVYLRVPRAALGERLTSRVGHYMPAALLDSQLQALEEPGPDEDALTLAADRPVPELVDEVLAWGAPGDRPRG